MTINNASGTYILFERVYNTIYMMAVCTVHVHATLYMYMNMQHCMYTYMMHVHEHETLHDACT